MWPWVMVGFLGFGASAAGRGLRTRAGLFVATVALVIGLFVYSIWHTETAPLWAYFSTLDRAWELGAGALLAMVRPRLRLISRPLRPVLGWVGLVGIVASSFWITEGSAFPGPLAVLPVVSTMLVIAAGTGAEQPYLLPLVNPVSRYVGDISYSLYLWHFPVIVLTGALIAPDGARYAVICIGLITVLSVFSYHWVEKPIHQSNWLEPKARTTDGARSPITIPPRLREAGVVIAISAVALATFVALSPKPATVTNAALPALVRPTAPGDPSLSEQQSERVGAALESSAFPALDPALDQLGIARWREDLKAVGCYEAPPETADSCVYGSQDATRTAVILGDSSASAWLPGIRAALEPAGYRIHQLTLGQCPTWDLAVTKPDRTAYTACTAYHRWSRKRVEELRPDLLVLATQGRSTVLRLASKDADRRSQISTAQAATLDQVEGSVGRTVILSAPPNGLAMQECVTRFSSPDDCVSLIGRPGTRSPRPSRPPLRIATT